MGDADHPTRPIRLSGAGGVITPTPAALPTAVKGAAEKPVIYISQNIWEAFMIASAAAAKLKADEAAAAAALKAENDAALAKLLADEEAFRKQMIELLTLKQDSSKKMQWMN